MSETTTDDAKALLMLFASRKSSAEAKEEAMKAFMSSPIEQREVLLNEALGVIESASANLFAGRRWPVRLPSRRAKLGCYRRLLESMEDEEPGAGARFTEGGDKAVRRRFLGVLLRQLRTGTGGVYGLEGEASKKRRLATSMEEMLRRTPENLETPRYSVVYSLPKTWEVREYEEFSVASTRRDRAVASDGVKLGTPSMPAAGGFQALAGYILGGRNQAEEKMAMTTPVLNSAATGEMSFVLPSRFWQPESEGGAAPPKPLEGSGVQIARKGGGALEQSSTLATLWFGGFAGAEEVARRKEELLSAVRADAEWSTACDDGDEAAEEQLTVLMQYNDPFTAPWNRRNEVAVPVRRLGV